MSARVSLTTYLLVGLLALFAAGTFACNGAEPTATPTLTPTPTPTPRSGEPTPTPMPTPTPTPALITVGPGDNPQAFLQAIPPSERDCMEQAFGTENLVEVFDTGLPSSEDMAKFTVCLSEETARRMMLGMLMMELGISEQGITCIGAELRDVSFLDLYGPLPGEPEQVMQAQTFTFQVFRVAFDCLSEGETAEIFGGIEEGGGPSMEQYKCLFESADDETIAELFAIGAGDPPRPELVDIINKCGPIPGLGEEGGPPELTPEHQNCVIEAIGETAFNEIFTGQRPPTLEEIQHIDACTDLGEEGGPPDLTPEQLQCVTQAIGEEAIQALMAGQRGPTPEEMQRILACGVELPGQ